MSLTNDAVAGLYPTFLVKVDALEPKLPKLGLDYFPFHAHAHRLSLGPQIGDVEPAEQVELGRELDSELGLIFVCE
jgi:hypothetical protein